MTSWTTSRRPTEGARRAPARSATGRRSPSPSRADGRSKRLEIAIGREWVDDGRAQKDAVPQARLDEEEVSRREEPLADASLEGVEISHAGRRVPKAEDVALGRGRDLEVAGLLQLRREAGGERERALDVLGEDVRPEGAEGDVQLQAHHPLGALERAGAHVEPLGGWIGRPLEEIG